MSALADDDGRLLEALLAIVVADGDVDPDELEITVRCYADLTGRTIEAEAMRGRAEARLAAASPTALPEDLAEGLDEAAKRRVLAAALTIAEADGFVLEEEDALLAALADGLGLGSATVREVVEGRSSHPSH